MQHRRFLSSVHVATKARSLQILNKFVNAVDEQCGLSDPMLALHLVQVVQIQCISNMAGSGILLRFDSVTLTADIISSAQLQDL